MTDPEYEAMHPLSPRQAEMLAYIRSATAANGFPPTIREIGVAMAIRSPNGVSVHLRALQRKGHIVRESRKSRSIRVRTVGAECCPTCGQTINAERLADARVEATR